MPRSTVIVGQCRHRLITDSRLIYANSRLCNNFIKCASSNNKERKLRNKMVYLFMIFVASVQSPNLRPPEPHSAPSTQQHALSLTIAQWMQHTIVCFAVWQAREKNSISLTNPNKFKIITRKVIQLSKFVKVVSADNRQLNDDSARDKPYVKERDRDERRHFYESICSVLVCVLCRKSFVIAVFIPFFQSNVLYTHFFDLCNVAKGTRKSSVGMWDS